MFFINLKLLKKFFFVVKTKILLFIFNTKIVDFVFKKNSSMITIVSLKINNI